MMRYTTCKFLPLLTKYSLTFPNSLVTTNFYTDPFLNRLILYSESNCDDDFLRNSFKDEDYFL